jgi:hypothetical protein
MSAVFAASPADLDNLAPLPTEGVRQAMHWYDFLCPFCYVGQQRNTIFEGRGFDVIDLPFQAHPDIPPGGRAVGPRSGPMVALIEDEARLAGLTINWPQRLPNTRMALAAAEWTRRHEPSSFRRWRRRSSPLISSSARISATGESSRAMRPTLASTSRACAPRSTTAAPASLSISPRRLPWAWA